MASWDAPARRTTAAFRDWQAVDGDLRALLRNGLRFAEEAYARMWEEAGRRAGAGVDQRAAFEALIDGIWQPDHHWALAAGLLADGVANYEAYVERAHAELEAAEPARWADATSAPTAAAPSAAAVAASRVKVPAWSDLVAAFAALDADAEPPSVARARALRRLLALRRGELRSEQQRGRVRAPRGDLLAVAAALDAHDAIETLDALARAARALDPVVVAHAAGRRPRPQWI